MKNETKVIFDQLFENYPKLGNCQESITQAFQLLQQSYAGGGKLLVCGNGGSAADAEHIVGELMKGFLLKRELPEADQERVRKAFPEECHYLGANLQRALPAISLVSQSALATAFINDVAPDMVFAQQVYGYGRPGDVLIGISTSGNSKNVANAVKIAKSFAIHTIGLTGEKGGLLKNLCDATITVPSGETFKIQEYHLPVYHALCAMIEREFFGK
ncbi:MAG TPA: phosphoheptose isomerase [Firmicutes bacterium]|nr:phosphoheptose isomerase [Bacillota bacterium]